jgi:hypothetical protein
MRIRSPHRAAPDAAAAWADTIRALAAAHLERRSARAASRWPLAHRCSAADRVAGAGPAPEVHGADAPAPRQAFCCRALA